MDGSAAGLLAACLYLLLFQAFGLLCARRLFPEEGPSARILLGSVWGSLCLHWLPVLWAFALGFSPAAHWAAVLTLLPAVGLAVYKGGRPKFSRPCLKIRPFYGAALLLSLFFAALVWRSFRWEGGRIWCSQATYGDMSMHLGFITSLARQGTFPPEYSLLPGTRLSYPFLGDSVSASLLVLGAPLRWAYVLPMALAGMQVFFGFYWFALGLLKDRASAAAAWLLFFFNGGLGFLWFLGGGKENFTRIFTAYYQTPTNLSADNIRWVNVLADMLLPQRATLFGWAVLFPALGLLVRAVFAGRTKLFLPAGLFAGLLPMIHTHSFLAFGLVCAVWLLYTFVRALGGETVYSKTGKAVLIPGLLVMTGLQWLLNRFHWTEAPGLLVFVLICAGLFLAAVVFLLARVLSKDGLSPVLRGWFFLFAAAFLLALPQLCYWTFSQAGGFVRGHFGWVIAGDNYLWFYLKNLGLAALLILAGLFLAPPEGFAAVSPALLIWFVAEFVEFQPNNYDNNKLLYPAYALLCCAAGAAALRLLRKLPRRGTRAAAGAVLFCLCGLSAWLTLGREWVSRYELYGEEALSLARYVETETPADALFLTDQRHNNEIAALTGRSVVCGSPIYLYFHGLDYDAAQQACRRLYEEPETSRWLFEETGVDYVVLSEYERASFAVDEAGLRRLFPVVYESGAVLCFK